MSCDIYLPKHGRYPEDALELVERAGDQVRLAPLGGGFVLCVPAEELAARFVPHRGAATLDFKPVLVTGDWLPDGEALAAYTQGRRWNGWAVPVFEKAAADRLVALGVVDYLPGLDAYGRPADEDSPAEVYAAETVEVDGQPRTVYAIGAGLWRWELAETAN